MNKKFIIFGIFGIFATIGFYTIVLSIITFLFLNNKKKAISYTWSNTLAPCGKEWCPSTVNYLTYPKKILDTYQHDVAKYCSDLVIRLDTNITKKNGGNVIIPKDLFLELVIMNNPNNPIFGMLCTHNDTAWLIYRGTSNPQEWIQDFTYNQVMYKQSGLIHKGFWNIYNKSRNKILNTLRKSGRIKKIIVSGHSLGGGVAILSGVDLYFSGYDVIVYTFASPRVGNSDYCNMVNSLLLNPNNKFKLYRIVNTIDIVPTLPFSVLPNFKDYEKPWFYSDCGNIYSFNDNWKSIINNHLMANYSLNIPLK
jgi:triacylglycerol lipase